ncbi:MAG: outer membrane beta-barrel protein [Pyrinomonadaceae bacterium]|nr:outer membrane beta-barrel protein [Sphingobacteriaceae bacterium]
MKKNYILLFLTLLSFTINAQHIIKGMVQDSSGQPLIGAIIKLRFATDSMAISAGVNGDFVFKNAKTTKFALSAAYIGLQTFFKEYSLDATQQEHTLPLIKLAASSQTLQDVLITSVIAVKVKEDTLEFNAKAFAVREGATVDAVLKKLPGVAVDKSGNVTTQGKPITKVRVNGKDFFGTDVATAIQNLPADIVKNLQVIDDYGDQAKLTGIKTGEPEKILNINIEEDKKQGYFARGTGGMGSHERYITSLRANFFKGERQVSVDGSMNNTNLRGGGGDGITNSKNINVNYRNKFNSKISIDGGYGFRNRNNNTFGTEFTQNFLTAYTRLENQFSNNTSQSNGHNFWGNFEYSIDTLNYLKISPFGSYDNSDNTNLGTSNISQPLLLTVRKNLSLNNSISGNVGTNVFLNHKFLKRGRNFSMYSSISFNKGDGYRDVQNDYFISDSSTQLDSTRLQYQLIDNSNQNFRTGTNLSYIEPLGKRSFVELSYNWNVSDTKTNRDTRDVNNGTALTNANLSNNFEYQFTTNRIGLNFRYLHEKYNYTLGLGTQQAVLEGQNLNKGINTYNKTINLVPTARMVYRFSKEQSFSVNYNGRNNQPGFNQLQPLTDNSNLQNTVTGNPDLRPEFIHALNVEYNQSDRAKGHTLYTNLSFSQTQNKIVTTKILVPNTANQITSYTNTDGFYNMRGNYSYSKPFAERKYTVTLEGGASFNNNIAFIDAGRNIAKNLVLNQGLEFELDIDDIIELEFNTSYSLNTTQYSQVNFKDRRTNTLEFGLDGENYFFKDLTLGYEISKRINYGFNNAAIKNPTIANVLMEYRFLKGNMGTLRLQGFDLLNQNTGVVRDVFDNLIVDRQTNRLGRYFLMSFGLRLSKFNGGK